MSTLKQRDNREKFRRCARACAKKGDSHPTARRKCVRSCMKGGGVSDAPPRRGFFSSLFS